MSDYLAILKGLCDGEAFCYFTDNHLITSRADADWEVGALDYLARLEALYRASGAPFAICGGDWLTSSNTKASALCMLSRIREKAKAMFGEAYFVLGNHDYNFQMRSEKKIVRNPYELTATEIASTLFSDFGNTYYSFTGASTRFYVFDSGIDWKHDTLTPHDEEQVLWFLGGLSARDDRHVILVPHMLHIAGEKRHPATEAYARIAAAYNARESGCYDGTPYNFSSKTGRVELILAGHNHKDTAGIIEGIPYMTTMAMPTANGPTVDFICIDYEKRVLHAVRRGDGESRTFSLLST